MPCGCETTASSEGAHFEGVAMPLVVVDVAAGDCGLIEMPDQRLLAKRQLVEAVRIDLHHRRIVNRLEEVLAPRAQVS